MQLIDIGVNLTNRRFATDLDQVVQAARDAGVTRMVITGTHLQASLDAAALASALAMHSTAGVHPHHASDWSDGTADGLRALLGRPEVVAVGECGLDFDRNYSPPDAQERAFVAQLALAAELGLPAFLHERAASARFADILRDFLPDLPGAVIHCFTGGRELLDTYLDLGLHIGVTGWICDERRGSDLRGAARYIPADRLMLETDAPYLPPRDLDPKPAGGRNEPRFLPHVLHRVATCRDEPAEVTARATTATAQRFFGLPS